MNNMSHQLSLNHTSNVCPLPINLSVPQICPSHLTSPQLNDMFQAKMAPIAFGFSKLDEGGGLQKEQIRALFIEKEINEIKDNAARLIEDFKAGKKIDYNRIFDSKFLKALDLAIKENRADEFKDLVENVGVGWNERGSSLVALAANARLPETVRFLGPLLSFQHDSDKCGWTPLNLAVHNGDAATVRALIEIPGINSNEYTKSDFLACKSHLFPTAPPIFEAAEKGHAEIVRMLVDLPDLDFKQFRYSGWTPQMAAEGNGHVEAAKAIKLSGKDKYSEFIKSVKLLTHSLEINLGSRRTPDNAIEIGALRIDSNGYLPRMAAEFMNSTLDKFDNSYPNAISRVQLDMIQHAFDNIEPFSSKVALDDFKSGKPILISTGFTGAHGGLGHSIQVLLMDSYLMICNKGNGVPIEAYKIDSSKVTHEILDEIKDTYKAHSMAEGVDKVFGKIDLQTNLREIGPVLEKLKASRNEGLCKWIETLPFASLKQKIGNCAWESLETAVYAIMAVQTAIENNLEEAAEMVSKGILLSQKVKEQFQRWETYTKLQALHNLFDRSEELMLNPSLIASKSDASMPAAADLNRFIARCSEITIDGQEFSEERQSLRNKKWKNGLLSVAGVVVSIFQDVRACFTN